jgi:hypothetical protein
MDIPLYEKIAQEGPKLSQVHADYLHKVKAKEIAQKSADVKVSRIVKTFEKYYEFSQTDLNPKHILKAVRGSGMCLDLSNVRLAQVRSKIKEWDIYFRMKNMKPQYLIEEKIEDAVFGVTGTAADYKFFCFHGKPVYFLCRFDKNRNFYDLEYNPIKLEGSQELPQIQLAPMIKIAELLSAPFPFVRIDLYNGADGIYFGEYTFHVRNGKQEFPLDLELKFGKLW